MNLSGWEKNCLSGSAVKKIGEGLLGTWWTWAMPPREKVKVSSPDINHAGFMACIAWEVIPSVDEHNCLPSSK